MSEVDGRSGDRVRRRRRRVLVMVAAALALLVGPPAVHLTGAHLRDQAATPITRTDQPTDFGRLDTMDAVRTVVLRPPLESAEAQLDATLTWAAEAGVPVSIAGARHSMGGQTLAPRGVYIDTEAFRCVTYDPQSTTVTVCAGTPWSEVLDAIAPHGRAVAVMQSNADFSVGGTVSVNAHGWQVGRPPVGATVRELRVVGADGQAMRASRDENAELFRHVIGGYGLFGVITSVTLETVPDMVYEVEREVTPRSELLSAWQEREGRGAEFLYGRIRLDGGGIAEDVMLSAYFATGREAAGPSERNEVGLLPRLVFRGGIGSPYGKALRWHLERAVGGEATGELRRSTIQNETSAWYLNRDATQMDVLHEYFVPRESLPAFLDAVDAVVEEQGADPLNMTVRAVAADAESALPYAREDVLAVVMFFHDAFGVEGDARQRRLSRALVDAALANGGTFYLPYRLHASPEQFRQAYPTAEAFFAAKRRHDPGELFVNRLWLTYGRR